MLGRRAGDAEVDLARPGVAHHLDDLKAGGAAHDRIVDQHDPLARDDRAVGVVLALDPGVARAVRRLDEGPPDIVRADDAELKWYARLLGKADCGGHPAIGYRHDQIGVDRRFAGQFDPDPLAHLVDRPAAHHRIGAAEIDVLEDAGAWGDLAERAMAADPPVLAHLDQFARLDLADEFGTDDIERDRLAGEDDRVTQSCPSPAAGCPADRGRRSSAWGSCRSANRHLRPSAAHRRNGRAGSGSGWWRSRWMMTSVSEVDWKIAPLLTRSRLRCIALEMLPLCAMAKPPRARSANSGWTLRRPEPPVVE